MDREKITGLLMKEKYPGIHKNGKRMKRLVLTLLWLLIVGTVASYSGYQQQKEQAADVDINTEEAVKEIEKEIEKETTVQAQRTTRKFEDEPDQLYARSAVLLDGKSGRVLYGKEADTIRPMASTTKIMTCILALEFLKEHPDQIITVSKEAAAQPKVHLGMQEGEKYYLQDLLYSLMLESHNDSAVAVAEGVAGSVAQFAQMMNQKVRALGCKNTHFITPNGLDAKDDTGIHATTARELALIMRYCMTQSEASGEFLTITGTRSYQFQDVDQKRNFSCRNHNAFLDMMEGAVSGKTGFTGDAGYCYVGAVIRDDRVFIVSLLACGWPGNKGYKWKDTMQLMQYGIEHYQYKETGPEKTEDLPCLTVLDGFDACRPYCSSVNVPLEIEENGQQTHILMRDGERIEKNVTIQEKKKAPVKKGMVMGNVSYELDGEEICSYKVTAGKTVPERTYGKILGVILEKASLY